jgi:hypothetical protein
MDDVANLSIEQLKRDLLSLRRENQAAMKTIEKLLKDINKKNEEIQHLTELVANSVPLIAPPVVILENKISPEEEIAEIQLHKLNQIAKTRSLTLEETRMYDLLVKNKRLAQEKSIQNITKGHFRDISEIELVKVAGRIKSKNESNSN